MKPPTRCAARSISARAESKSLATMVNRAVRTISGPWFPAAGRRQTLPPAWNPPAAAPHGLGAGTRWSASEAAASSTGRCPSAARTAAGTRSLFAVTQRDRHASHNQNYACGRREQSARAEHPWQERRGNGAGGSLSRRAQAAGDVTDAPGLQPRGDPRSSLSACRHSRHPAM